MGAHPSAPSGVSRPPAPPASTAPATLDALIAAAPERELGPECTERFGGRLPFLLKVLSADRALSIQVHPSRAQAEAGFRAENERGLAPGDPARDYVDDWPKPELLCALTPFEVLTGLRTPQDAAGILRALAVDQLRPLAARLEHAADRQVLRDALGSVLTWPEADRKELVARVIAACERLASQDGPYAGVCIAALRVTLDHPGDLGVVALLLMRHTLLEPGEAVFMPAGGLHAYLRGTGIELLANSDNVVRAGLTGKHVNVPELLKLVDPAVSVPILTPRPLAVGIATFDTPAPEFRLYLITLPAAPVPAALAPVPAALAPGLASPAPAPAALAPGLASPAPAPAALAPGLASPAPAPAALAPGLASPAPAPALPAPGVPAVALPGIGPRILLCLDGACELRSASGDGLKLNRGDPCFIPASDGPVHATGHARLVLAAPGLS
jgi:mannose-6-phosphate isomerase